MTNFDELRIYADYLREVCDDEFSSILVNPQFGVFKWRLEHREFSEKEIRFFRNLARDRKKSDWRRSLVKVGLAVHFVYFLNMAMRFLFSG